MTPRKVGTPATQRNRRLECDAGCGRVAYQSRLWIAQGVMGCPCGGRMMPSAAEDRQLIKTR